MLLKLKTFALQRARSEETTHRMEEIFANHVSDNRIVSRTCYELLRLNKKTSQSKNEQRTQVGISPKKIYEQQTDT